LTKCTKTVSVITGWKQMKLKIRNDWWGFKKRIKIQSKSKVESQKQWTFDLNFDFRLKEWRKKLECSFCGRKKPETNLLMLELMSFCDKCIEQAHGIVLEELKHPVVQN
jgi:hypothetical protein